MRGEPDDIADVADAFGDLDALDDLRALLVPSCHVAPATSAIRTCGT